MKRFDLFHTIAKIPVDIMMLVFAASTAYTVRLSYSVIRHWPVLFDLSLGEYVRDVTIVLPLWVLLYAFFGTYRTRKKGRFAQEVIRIFVANICALALVAMYIMFTLQFFDSRFLVVATCALASVYTILGRLFLLGVKKVVYYFGFGHRRIVIFGDTQIARDIQAYFMKNPSLGYGVVKRYKVAAGVDLENLEKLAIDEIYVVGKKPSTPEYLHLLDFAREHNIVFTYSADMYAAKSANFSMYPVAGVPVVSLTRTRLEGWSRIIKRIADIIGSLLLLVLVSPVSLVTALVILFESGRPVLYKNERVGFRRSLFFALKFRSMYQKDSTGSQFGESGKVAEKKEQALIKTHNTKKGPIYKIANDPRVTPFGKFIRRWSIDELPQCINVLKGEMSLVGPRPHQPREVEGYNKEHRGVFIVKPGMTGLAQITGRSDLTYEEEVALDMFYIENWSIWLDVIIFIKTPFVLLKKRVVV